MSNNLPHNDDNSHPLLSWLIFGIGAIFYGYEFLLRILPSVITSDLMRVHHLTTAGLGYLAAIYYVVYTAMQLPVGLLIDWYGPKRLLLFATGVCALGSFLFASPSSLLLALIGRFLIGLGSAFGFVGVLRLASLWLPTHRFALATGLVTTLGMIGGVFGNVVLSHIIVATGWRGAVLVSAWIGLILMGIFYFIPDSIHHRFKKTDQDQHWRHLLIQAASIARMPIIWLNALAGSLLYVPLSIFGELWGISYLKTVQNLSEVDATWAISWLMWGWAVGAPLAGWIAGKIGNRYRVFLTGSITSGLFVFFILNTQFSNNIILFLCMFLFGILCSGQILAMVIVHDVCPLPLLATGIAITNMIIMASSIVFQPLIGMLMKSYSAALTQDSHSATVIHAYTHAMYVVPGSIFLGVILLLIQVWRIKRGKNVLHRSAN